MNSAVLAISTRPDLFDRTDQSRRPVGDDQPWGGEPTRHEITTELDPVLLGLARAQTHGNQLPVAVFVNSAGANHGRVASR